MAHPGAADGRRATSANLAEELGEPVPAVQQARFASQGYSASSIDAAMCHGMCFCSDEADEDIDRTEARLIIEALTQLDDDERRLIQLRFYEQRSQAEIAEEIGTSQVQVSRLLSRLLLKMRHHRRIGQPARRLVIRPQPSRPRDAPGAVRYKGSAQAQLSPRGGLRRKGGEYQTHDI